MLIIIFFMLFKLHDDMSPVLLMIVLCEVFYAFGLMLIGCEFGQRITDAFEECNETIVQLNWYLFPSEIQRITPIIINFGQQPIVFYCYGSIAFDRELFKLVSMSKQKKKPKSTRFIESYSLVENLYSIHS